MTRTAVKLLFLNILLKIQRSTFGLANDLLGIFMLDFLHPNTILRINNTPPASRLVFGLGCSAPRGVTRFWGTEK